MAIVSKPNTPEYESNYDAIFAAPHKPTTTITVKKQRFVFTYDEVGLMINGGVMNKIEELLKVQGVLLDGSDYDLDLLATDQVLARRVVLREWLRENGFEPDQVLVFENDGRAHKVLKQVNRNAVDACLRLWLLEHGEDLMNAPGEDVKARANQLSLQLRVPLPTLGKMSVYDGRPAMPSISR